MRVPRRSLHPTYPITGHFTKSQLYQVDPVGFSAAAYFEMLTPPN
ncbi:uncharacterized protein METZ01_LOCUS26509 [marine metagenome]|uniref:Uncharacterized protein n=1 Tax=marine metagenome TaxID=408172 RepID=A0A381Q2T6_9ZZZZ